MRLLREGAASDDGASPRRRRRLPPLLTLRALEAAVRHQSYSRAADELAVTHSAVSQQIRNLEADLGARLFVRRAGAMIPTSDAQRLAAEVSRAMGVLHEAMTAFEESPAAKPLVVSVEAMLGRRWLPPRLPRLLSALNIEVRIDNEHSNFTTDGVDAGIRFGTGDWKGLEVREVLSVGLTVVCSAGFARQHRLNTPADLARAPLLHRTGRPWTPWFEAQGLRPPPEQGLLFDDSLMLTEAAVAGVGAALLSPIMLDAELSAGRLVRPFAGEVPSPFNFYLVWRPDSRRTDRILEFHDWLVAEAREDIPA